ncbi:hypothetical protein QYF36_014386 [Acer negundo]|nr:hypothetical protein QYF36_014386 [Acer negundo]
MALPSAGTDAIGSSFAQAVIKSAESSGLKIPMRFPVDINGDLGFIFTEPEMGGERRKAEVQTKEKPIWQPIVNPGKGESTEVKTDSVQAMPNTKVPKQLVVGEAETFSSVNGQAMHEVQNVVLPNNMVDSQVVMEGQENAQLVLQIIVPPDVQNGVPEASNKGELQQFIVLNGVLHENVVSNTQCNEECEENRCKIVLGSPVLKSKNEDTTPISGLVPPQNIDSMAESAAVLSHDEEAQGGADVQGFVSDREEGEIPLVLGKNKGYDSDVELCQISRKSKEFVVGRRGLWRDLEEVQVVEQPWVVVGDFNIIRNDSERIGGNPRPLASMADFNDSLDRCGLLDLSSGGNHMSWCNGHEANLDRVVINSAYTTQFPFAHLEYLRRKTSDHCPMVVHFDRPHSSYGPFPFRFQNMWCSHVGFLSCVEEAWNKTDSVTGLWKLAIRLKRTKLALRAWNKNTFGRVEVILQDLEARLDNLECQLQLGYSQEVEAEYLVTKIELQLWEHREATRLNQIAKKTWLLEGGTGVETADLSSLINPTISEVDNEMLCMVPSEEEVKDAISSIPKHSSPGPDGFGLAFYIECLDIIKQDVIDAARDFFNGVPLPRFFSSSFIVLIPKVQDPSSFDKFRPISLCSVAYKIFSKILVKRMTRIIHKFVSPEQGAFVPGRSIFENITHAQEMVNSLNKKILGCNMMVKIDMAKAYDRIDWGFLLTVLKAFGFSSTFCSSVEECIKSPWFSVMMNGTFKGFFHPTRDDILIFLNGGKRSIWRLVEILGVSEGWSGQEISKEKSALFPSKHISSSRTRSLLRLTGFREVRNKVAGWKFKLLSQGERLVLLRHVLASMPIHILSVIIAPLATIARINSLLSNFFSGNVNGISKMKWRAWPKLCLPTGEGGLGVRDFKEYIKDSHFSLATVNHRGSRFWKSILSVFPKVYENVKVLVQGGNASFWYDRWLASGLLSVQVEEITNSNLLINDCWLNDSWDVNRLTELVGEEATLDILHNSRAGKSGPDLFVWTPSNDGCFSISSAWEVVRKNGDHLQWKVWIWHRLLPKHVSLCVWKAYFRCLAVDERVQARGVALASVCDCCVRKSGESLHHIQCSGEVATKATVKGVLTRLLPCLISWQLWMRRRKARMEGVQDSATRVWWSVKYWLHSLVGDLNASSLSVQDMKILQDLQIDPPVQRHHWHRLVAWQRPPMGWFKLNCDGSCRGNPESSGGGGVIRDDVGTVRGAYSAHFGHGTNNGAELRAITKGIVLCKRLNLFNVIIESDSKMVVDWLRAGKCTLWYLWDYWDDLLKALEGVNFMAVHQFREANQAADFLARQGKLGRNLTYEGYQNLPRFLRGVLHLDKLGFPS